MDLSEFIATDTSESDEDEAGDQDLSEGKKKESESDADETGDQDLSVGKKKTAEMYRAALIQSGDGSEGDDEGQNMEVTFATGLEDINKKFLEKKEKGQETVFKACRRGKKERKIARKNKTKTSSDDDNDLNDEQELSKDPDGFFEEPPSVKRSKKDGKGKKKKKENTALENEAEASRPELELLFVDENGANKKLKGYNMKHKKAKGKKGEETPDDTNLPTVGVVDDPRFSALLNNPEYALDPTDPNFKRSVAYLRQLAHTQPISCKEHDDVEPMEPRIQRKRENMDGTSQKDKHELSAMIKSIKMKARQLSVPSTVKRKNKTQSNGSTSRTKHKLPGSDRDRATKKARRQS